MVEPSGSWEVQLYKLYKAGTWIGWFFRFLSYFSSFFHNPFTKTLTDFNISKHHFLSIFTSKSTSIQWAFCIGDAYGKCLNEEPMACPQRNWPAVVDRQEVGLDDPAIVDHPQCPICLEDDPMTGWKKGGMAAMWKVWKVYVANRNATCGGKKGPGPNIYFSFKTHWSRISHVWSVPGLWWEWSPGEDVAWHGHILIMSWWQKFFVGSGLMDLDCLVGLGFALRTHKAHTHSMRWMDLWNDSGGTRRYPCVSMSQNSLSEFWIAKASMVSVSIQSASPIESISSVFGVI